MHVFSFVISQLTTVEIDSRKPLDLPHNGGGYCLREPRAPPSYGYVPNFSSSPHPSASQQASAWGVSHSSHKTIYVKSKTHVSHMDTHLIVYIILPVQLQVLEQCECELKRNAKCRSTFFHVGYVDNVDNVDNGACGGAFWSFPRPRQR